MLRWPALPFSRPCSSCSDPMPMRSPAGPMTAVPPQLGWDGGGEDRLVEHIFPVSGEFLLGDHPRRHRAMQAAGAGDDHPVADRGPARTADREGRQVHPGQRLDQAEAGLLVIGQGMARHRRAGDRRQPHRFGLGDEIADGQDEPAVPDQDAVAGALGAERLGGEGVVGNHRAQTDHRGDGRIEIVVVICGLRLVFRRHFPVAQARHRRESFFADGDEIIQEGPFKSWCRAPVGGAQWTRLLGPKPVPTIGVRSHKCHSGLC